MQKFEKLGIIICGLGLFLVIGCGDGGGGGGNFLAPTLSRTPTPGPPTAAIQGLVKMLDQYHIFYYVYHDFDVAGNHFFEWHTMADTASGTEDAVPPMDANYPETSNGSGFTCIKCIFKTRGENWGGHQISNGILPASNSSQVNWGFFPNAGVDLRGATILSFKARGNNGGERVKFYAFGTGWDENEGFFYTGTTDDGITPYKNVIPEDVQSWGVLALDKENTKYRRALEYVQNNHKFGQGFDFDTDRDGVWFEGTAHMALAYSYIGDPRGDALINYLNSALASPSFLLPAAD